MFRVILNKESKLQKIQFSHILNEFRLKFGFFILPMSDDYFLQSNYPVWDRWKNVFSLFLKICDIFWKIYIANDFNTIFYRFIFYTIS